MTNLHFIGFAVFWALCAVVIGRSMYNIGFSKGKSNGWIEGSNWTHDMWKKKIKACIHPPPETLVSISCSVCGAFKLPDGPLRYYPPNNRMN